MDYRVQVRIEDGFWLADVPQLEGTHTYARNLKELRNRVREVIALTLDLPEGAEAALGLQWELSIEAKSYSTPGLIEDQLYGE